MSEQIPALWSKEALAVEDRSILGGTFGMLWLVYLLNTFLFGDALLAFGILPRTLWGLVGIFFAPLLHSGLLHILANTVFGYPVARLVMRRTRMEFLLVSVASVIGSGGMVWLFGGGLTVGFSGVICGYMGYLFVLSRLGERIGLRVPAPTLRSLFFLLLFSLLPGISLMGHLGGFCSGAAVAVVLLSRAAKKTTAY